MKEMQYTEQTAPMLFSTQVASIKLWHNIFKIAF